MPLWVHIDAHYLAELKAISHAGGYHYFRNKTKLPIQSDNPQLKHNHPVIVIFLIKFIDAVMTSTQESETGGSYINSKEALPIHQTAIEMDHPQGSTPLQFNNKSKGVNMLLYLICGRYMEKKFIHIGNAANKT